MQVRLLYTTGNGAFNETLWDKPEIQENEIEVKAVLTGVCRSDIDMMQGTFGPLPLSMQGHEGLGQVTKVGEKLKDQVQVGDFVATRGEPAYADFYNVREKEFVVVPGADPKYILEPVACGINVVYTALSAITSKTNPRVLIIGTGFLSWVAWHSLKELAGISNADVLGSANTDMWTQQPGITLIDAVSEQYDIVIDLAGHRDFINSDIYNDNPVYILAAEKHPAVSTSFAKLLWKGATIFCPSPRNQGFHTCMMLAKNLVEREEVNIDKFWTNCYNRDTQWRLAFSHGRGRPVGYGRGYIKWD